MWLSSAWCNAALHFTASDGKLEIVRLLLNNGANPNIMDNDGDNCLEYAIAKDHSLIVKLLLENKIEIRDALHQVAKTGNLDIANLILNNGVNINEKNKDDLTALYIATQNGHLELVKLFLENGADKSISDKDGKTPMDIASEKAYLEIEKLFN